MPWRVRHPILWRKRRSHCNESHSFVSCSSRLGIVVQGFQECHLSVAFGNTQALVAQKFRGPLGRWQQGHLTWLVVCSASSSLAAVRSFISDSHNMVLPSPQRLWAA